MTEVPPDTTVIGPDGPVPFGDVFEGRHELVVYSHMFYDGKQWELAVRGLYQERPRRLVECRPCSRAGVPGGVTARAAVLSCRSR